MRRSVPTFIIDASALFREGLVRILARSRFRVVAHFQSLGDFRTNWATERGLVLIELHSSSVVLAQLPSFKMGHEHIRVVIFSDRFDSEEVLKAIDFGADGYLLKRYLSADTLLKSLDLVLQGETILPQRFMQLIRFRLHPHIELPPSNDDNGSSVQLLPARSAIRTAEPYEQLRLSDREHLILQHLTQGASNKHIARDLRIAEATVKVHVKAILRKIGVRNRTQAAIWAVNTQVSVARRQ
jgi:two-component system nitrate/nitrite response regulator NarL